MMMKTKGRIGGRPVRLRHERRRLELGVTAEEAEVREPESEIEQQRVQEVPRLEQRPDRKHGREERVDEEDHRPRRGARPGLCGHPDRRELETEPDATESQNETHGRDREQRDAPAVHQDAGHHRDDHQQRGRKDGPRIARLPWGELQREQTRDDEHEHAHREGDAEEDDEVEEGPGPRSDDTFRHGADAHPPRPEADHHRREVVDAPDENGSEHDPQHRGDPSPDHRDGRPQHRRQPGDRGVVVPEEHRGSRRHVVDAVLLSVRRSAALGVEPEDTVAQETSVEPVGEEVEEERPGSGIGSGHGARV